MSSPLLALDFGGTKHSAALALPGARSWLALRRAPAPPQAGAERDIAAMLALADSMLDGQPPAAVGVSFGGPVDSGAGVVRLSHHVPGWENLPLRERLQA